MHRTGVVMAMKARMSMNEQATQVCCPFCGKPVQQWETTVMKDGDVYHIDCAAKDEDDVFFDRDMEFGD